MYSRYEEVYTPTSPLRSSKGRGIVYGIFDSQHPNASPPGVTYADVVEDNGDGIATGMEVFHAVNFDGSGMEQIVGSVIFLANGDRRATRQELVKFVLNKKTV